MTTSPLDKLSAALETTSQGNMPDADKMVDFALMILKNSETGAHLADVAESNNFKIDVIKTPEEVTYIPSEGHIQVGIRTTPLTPPARFILLLAGALREAEQELQGQKSAEMGASLEEHLQASMPKQADKVAHLCAIAHDLNSLLDFTEYNFLNELRKMGYGENLDTYLKALESE